MTQVSAPLLAAGTLVQSHGSDREKLAGVAKQFEAILVRQMLASARKAGFGDSLFGGQAMETFTTMQDEQFADMAAKAGSFGLAAQIEAQLSRFIGANGGAGASIGSARTDVGGNSSSVRPEPVEAPMPPQANGEG